MALEAAGLSDIHNRHSKAAQSHGRRSLRLEPLEARHLLDAGGAASLISAVWFQDVSDQSADAHAGVADWTAEGLFADEESGVTSTGEANVYDWIVQFDTASVAGISSLTETATLLTGGGVEFEVLRGLGLVGQALVRSSNASVEAVADWLSENTYITSFEQDAISQVDTSVPTDPLYNQLWGMTMIDAPQAWSLSTGSSSVVVGVIDTGVDYTHVDLAANMWTNPGEIAGNGIDDDGNGFVDDIYGYDFINNDSDPMDDNAHGTHVSGTIAAAANNGLGVAGVNWSSSIMALKFLNSNGSGYSSDAVRAINYATMMRTQYGVNVRVLNNSWGGAGYSYAMYSAIEASNNADILFVAAAGNSGSNNDVSAQYPANYTNSNVISVAAVSQSGQLASFSSYGATTVDLAAPGVSIYSTIPGNRYAAYSGTSMATPHVAGVAALAFAYASDATASQVRDAILGGTEYSSALAGTTATGGILNALGTLELLADQMHGPVISHLTASPSSVMSGDSATLTAHGVTDNTGNVTRVYFYLDANNNSQIDAGDSLVGSTSAITDSEASVSFNSSGYAAGSYSFLATAVDNNGEYSTPTSAILTVLPADDYGDSAASAGAVSVPSSTQATLGVSGDVDWFAFQAVAGKLYTFTTELNTLNDSLLYLYAGDGTTALRYNDDIAYGNYASQIQWTAPSSGTYYLAVASFGGLYAGSYSLNVLVDNSTPVLPAIADQSISHSQTTLTIPINASDADGDPLAYSVEVHSVDAMSQKAYDLDQQYDLYQWYGSFWTNTRGQGEKYIASYTNGVEHPLLIFPNGELYQWEGSMNDLAYITTLSVDYYNDPFLLCSAQTPDYSPVSEADVQADINDGVLTLTRSADYHAAFCVVLTASDGMEADTESFLVEVTNSAPAISSIADQTISHATTSISLQIDASDADGDTLQYTVEALAADPMAQTAYDLDQQYDLYQWYGSFWTDIRGQGEKYIASYTNGVEHPLLIFPDGKVYQWDGGMDQLTYITTLSTDYYNDPFLLCDAQIPAYSPVDASDVQFSVNAGVLTITRAADFQDSFIVQLAVSDGTVTATESFLVEVTNSAPELASIADQTMSYRSSTLLLEIDASDADGDELQYTVEALAADPIAQTAYDLDQQYDLYQWYGSFWTDIRGQGEKYIASYTNGVEHPLLIFPDGKVYQWDGGMDQLTYITTLSTDYYNDPFLLCDAQSPEYSLADTADVQLSVNEGVLTITRAADFQDSFVVRLAVSDGTNTVNESFLVEVANSAPELASIADHTMSSDDTTLSLQIDASDADGDTLQYTVEALAADPMAQTAYDLDQQYDLYQWYGSFWTDIRGQGEKYIASYTNGVEHPLLIFPDGKIYQWDGGMDQLTYITTLSTDYYNDPFLLCDAHPPALTSLSSQLVAVGMQGNLLTISRDAGYNGNFQVQVSVTDGVSTTSETFGVSVLGAASLQSMSVASAMPTAVPSMSNISDGLAAKSPDLRAIWSNYYADDRFSLGKESLSLDGVASRFDETSNMLREDVFSHLSTADDSPAASEDELLDEIVASISSLRREVDGMLFGHDDYGLRDSLENDADDHDFRLGESLERNAVDSFQESFAEQFDLPTVLS